MILPVGMDDSTPTQATAKNVKGERIFSVAGEIISKKSSRLTPDHANMLVFLNKNKPLL